MSSDVPDYRPVAELFGALASPVRAAIVHLLTIRPHNVTEIGEALSASQPLVSQHLRVLRETGIVTAERHGRTTAYALADEHVAHIFLDALTHSQEERHVDHD